MLRSKFTIDWKKDRGKNPDGTERHNDLHLTRAEKDLMNQDEKEAHLRAAIRKASEEC